MCMPPGSRSGKAASAIRSSTVVAVEAISSAARMGLEEGDVIVALNGIEIRDIESFESVASQRPRAWQIILQRGGRVIRSVVSG